MRTLILLSAFTVSSLMAQTTGLVGTNDYTITCTGCLTGSLACGAPAAGLGGTSGSTTGTPGTTLTFDASAGGALTFAVSCAPFSAVQIFLSSAPCSPCFVPLPPVSYLIPSTACGSSTNQSVDLDLSAPLVPLFNGSSGLTGNFTSTIPLPPIVLGCASFCTQAVILDSSVSSGFLVTQAYDLTII